MSTVDEIESAIEKLSPQKLAELFAWLDEYRQTLQAADTTFTAYDEEEEVT